MTGILNLLASGKPPAAAVTAYQIERSLRFNSNDSAYLSWTPPVAGNRKTWTWSGWIKRTNFATTNILFSALNTGQSTFRCEFDATSNKLYFRNFISDTPNLNLITTQVFRDPSAWYHLVCAVDTTQATASDRAKLYINGVQITSFDTATYPSQNYDTWVNATTVHNIGSEIGAYGWFNGYIADVHFIDGQQLTPAAFGAINATTGVWTPSAYTGTYGINGFRLPFNDNSSALNLGCNTAQTGDELWPYTTLHLSGNPANTSGYNCFSDKSSQNSGNGFPITVNGDTRSSSFSPYGTSWSAYFDGASDYIQYTNSDFSVSTGDFTAEWWMYVTSDKSQVGIMTAASNPNLTIGYGSGSANARQVYVEWGGSGAYIGSMSNYANVWVHICVMRSSGTVYTFQNGTLLSSVSKSAALGSTANMVIGTNSGDIAAQSFPGYLSNVRFSKVAVYSTSGFTPSTSPLTRTSQGATNVQFLTLQSNRFLDSNGVNTPASSPLTITKNGDVTVASFSPFLETDTTSGSGYFNGNGSFLATPTTGQFATTGNFTVSFWFYTLSSNQQVILGNHANTSTTSGNWMVTVENGTFGYYINGGGGAAQIYSAANTFVPGQWYFVSFSRSGNTVTAYLNGATVGSITKTDTFGNASQTVHIGQRPYAGSPVSVVGYIADVRFVDGTAIAGTTVPTAPVTAISGTQLLTLQDRVNYNNSGFQDSSGNNHIITRPSGANVTQGSFSPFSNSGWSIYFPGTDPEAAIETSVSSKFAFGGSWTVELWYYPVERTGTYPAVFAIIDNTYATGFAFFDRHAAATSYFRFEGFGGAGHNLNTVVQNNTWYHIALSYNGSVLSFYINGVLDSTLTVSISSSNRALRIGRNYDFASYNESIKAYISNFRVISGQNLYTGTFTPSTIPLTATTVGSTGAGAASTITGTVQFLGCQSNRFLDNSSNNFTITTSGSPTVQAFSPFTSQSSTPTSYSAYFDGTSDYLTTTVTGGINSTTFSIEFWAYFTVLNSASPYYVFNLSGGSGQLLMGKNDPGFPARCLFQDDSGATVFNLQGGTINANQWMHFACVKNGANVSLWLDGTRVATTSSATISPTFTATSLLLGGLNTSVALVNGYVSNFRLVSGSAAYDTSLSSIPVPTAPLNPISGTKLLTLQSNRLVDASINNATITRTGDVIPREFNPFGNTVTTMAYSPAVHGGSGYFDGSGDYLTVPSNAAFDLGSGDFTLESWVYLSSLSGQIIVTRANNSTTGPTFELLISGSSARFYSSSNGSSYNINLLSSVVPIINSWNHLAVTRNGSTFTIWVNGVSGGTATSALSLVANSNNLGIGGYPSGEGVLNAGYLSNVRLVKGTAVYTGNFTPPSGPLTAIPGTSLLLNFNNAGIVDYTGKNVLETLGNASNVTSLKKSLISAKGSLYFDGTVDALAIPNSNLWKFGTGDFTVEMWVYTSNPTTYQALMDTRAVDTASPFYIGTVSGRPYWYDASGSIQSASAAIASNTWTHLAISRSGSTLRIFLNGTQAASGTNSSSIDPAGVIYIGRDLTNTTFWNGYIQDLRITKYARYTGTFTPPVRSFAHNVLDIGHKQWVPVNFSVASGAGNDSLVDTPTPYGIDAAVAGSYATFDAASSSVTLSNGNLTLTGVGGSGYNKANTTTAVSSGKWYFEATLVSAATDTSIGISQGNSSSTYPGQEATSYAYVLEKGQKFNGNSPAAYAASLTAGDVFMCAFDLDNNKLFFGKNGSWFASSNPVTGANPAFTLSAGTYRAVGRPYSTNTVTFNFGASTFAYTPPAGFAGLQDFVSGGVVRGNYCTWNVLEPSLGTRTIANGALDVANSGNGNTYGNFGMATGKWYFECTLTAQSGATGSCYVGLTASAFSKASGSPQDRVPGIGYCMDGTKNLDATVTSYGATYAVNDIIGCAVDIDAGSVTFYKNGVSQGTITKTLLGQGTGSWIIYTVAAASAASNSWTLNAGQRPFNYTAPSGFKALCTQNLSTPSIVKSNTAFDALVWSGDGVNNRKLTTNFSPDLFWVKARNSAAFHSVNDSVRGANAILQTNTTSAEQVNSNGYVTTFAADGVNVTNGSDINASGTNYVGWAWDAGTTTVTNTAGTISAQVCANPTTGFSIVSYTGVAGGNSVGHGLGVAPKFIIVKGRTTSAWIVYTQMTGINAYLYLHTTGASVSDAGIWSGTGSGVTSSTFGVRGASDNGLTGVNLIAYCFAEVPGFSAFGTYTGNGSADGPFIYTGFRPRWVMWKATGATESWMIIDTARDTVNVMLTNLCANLPNAESIVGSDRSQVDYLSNGFKMRNAGGQYNSLNNQSGLTYIYAAFAENPFKYSLAR